MFSNRLLIYGCREPDSDVYSLIFAKRTFHCLCFSHQSFLQILYAAGLLIFLLPLLRFLIDLIFLFDWLPLTSDDLIGPAYRQAGIKRFALLMILFKEKSAVGKNKIQCR
jgi:hypothetical protein